ncbi:hypothetical protein [Ensifer sp. LCM 4579]|uniref:hypothetical protein n=1 Tax=Ensifer sp. LCM 4579 TaxID=1848292 RepID=UPI0010421A28|nr:hypothetical protein [Ensifer sp. LCM 4579]
MTQINHGTVDFVNDWGEGLSLVTVRHRRGNNPHTQEQKTIFNISPGESLKSILPIIYETGIGAPFDYWWIKFCLKRGGSYTINDNFYSSISHNDDGQVTLTVDGNDEKLHVTFSASSSCKVSIVPVS